MGRLLFPEDPNGPVDIPTVCPEKSLTRQSEAESCDINVIMKRYEKTGVLPQDMREAVFADVSAFGSFREVMETVRQATDGFMALPADVRARFANDPVSFIDFCADPANLGELERLGLVEASQAPVSSEVAAEAPQAQS